MTFFGADRVKAHGVSQTIFIWPISVIRVLVFTTLLSTSYESLLMSFGFEHKKVESHLRTILYFATRKTFTFCWTTIGKLFVYLNDNPYLTVSAICQHRVIRYNTDVIELIWFYRSGWLFVYAPVTNVDCLAPYTNAFGFKIKYSLSFWFMINFKAADPCDYPPLRLS